MASWSKFQGPPTIHIDRGYQTAWPDSEQALGYDPAEPWRLLRYNPYQNGQSFDKDIIEQYKKHGVPVGAFYVTATYEQLLRFADVRQTRFKGPPNRDGSNTNQTLATFRGRSTQTNGSPQLRHMWECYATILRAIHREGQIKPGIGGSWVEEPWNELAEMIRTYPSQLKRLECDRFRGDDINNKVIPGFEWLYPFGQRLVEMHASFQAIITWARKAKTDPKPYLELVVERLPSIMKLMMSLKLREIRFEDAVGDEHFEDISIDKRLWIISPRDFYDSGIDTDVAPVKWINFLNFTVKPQLAQFRKELRDRFDYRLLVDWGYGRLWKKLYILFDTQNQDEKDAIKEFSNFATGHSKLAFDLFAIHPLDKDEHEADPCVVCLTDFEHDDMIMETHCNHHFHPACLFTAWDQPNHFQNRCPTCRTSQGILREKVDFEAERQDKCYEAKDDLSRLDAQLAGALCERVLANRSFREYPVLVDLWCRTTMKTYLEVLKESRDGMHGWNVIR